MIIDQVIIDQAQTQTIQQTSVIRITIKRKRHKVGTQCVSLKPGLNESSVVTRDEIGSPHNAAQVHNQPPPPGSTEKNQTRTTTSILVPATKHKTR